jgi:predicted transcriptional regulator
MAVLLSVRPKWCELIASGKKTVEVRKTRPKIETPFKCYIYCTKPKMITKYVFKPEDYPEYMRPEKPVFCKVPDGSSPYCSVVNGNGKVIGEFVCDVIFTMSITYSDPTSRIALKEFPYTCLTDRQIIDYLGNGNQGYGWHISNLVIYGKPKELNEFYLKKKCHSCKRSGYESSACIYDEDCIVPAIITRPPQSWCYVQDLEE